MKNAILPYRIDILGCSILFAYCKTFKEVQKYIEKKKLPKIQYLEIMQQNENQYGMVLSDDYTNIPYLIYIRGDLKGWELWDTIIHETNHLVYYLAKYYEFRDETEFQARLQEMIVKDIRGLLKK